MSVDARRLRAEGVSIPTAEGEGVLRYSLLGLSVLEEDFGSVTRAWQALNECATADEAGLVLDGVRPMITLARFVRAGLASPGRIPTMAQAADMVEMLPADLWLACREALLLAFPEPDSGKAGRTETATSPSTGQGSTTLPPSDGAEPTTSSGA